MSKMTPINCCCDARKTLGFVPLDQEKLIPGRLQTFCAMNGDEDTELTLPVGRVHCATADNKSAGDLIAIKSMDTPLEVLKQIPGFEEFNSKHAVGTPEYRDDQAAAYIRHELVLEQRTPQHTLLEALLDAFTHGA